MNEISEETAQKLADLIGCYIVVDSTGLCYASTKKPHTAIGGLWDGVFGNSWGHIPVKIKSNRNWYKQIWEPTGKSDDQK